jgi:low temperature requirement protein LtrA
MAIARGDDDQRVTDLELFFDLVFVFAITQVTTLMAHEPTWAGLGKGMLMLAALWFAWAAFAWLTTNVDPDEGAARAAMFATMVGLLIASLAVPHAFGADALVFGAAYCFVRAMQIAVFAAGNDARLGAVARTIGPWMVIPGVLILAAGAFDGAPRYALWVLAVAVNTIGPFVVDRSSWRINPGHFAERHGGFVIIALGESIVAAGVGVEGHALDARLVVAAALVVAVAAALWWTYFDIGVHVAARRLAELTGDERSRLARDSYTFLHLPMVAGIVLFALGAKEALAQLGAPLHTVPAVALCGGLALYAAGQVAFRVRNVRSFSRRRSVLVVALLALIAPATQVDAVLALVAVGVAWWSLIAYELVRYRDQRQRMRHPQEVHA